MLKFLHYEEVCGAEDRDDTMLVTRIEHKEHERIHDASSGRSGGHKDDSSDIVVFANQNNREVKENWV